MAIYRIGEKFRVQFGKDKNGWSIRRDVAVYRCECGQAFVMQCRSESRTKTCGCLIKNTVQNRLRGNTYRRTHNMSGTATYRSWRHMRERCTKENHIEYSRYGARGIRVCERWEKFENFLEDMGERPSGCSIDRIDVMGDYSPGNCRWATATEQARNRTTSVILSIDGVEKTVAEWAEHEHAAKDKTIYNRLKKGWSHREAVFGRCKIGKCS